MKKFFSFVQSLLTGIAILAQVVLLVFLVILQPMWGEINRSLEIGNSNFNFIVAALILTGVLLLYMMWILIWGLVWKSPVTSVGNLIGVIFVVVLWSFAIWDLYQRTRTLLPSLLPLSKFFLYFALLFLVASAIFGWIYRSRRAVAAAVLAVLFLLPAGYLGYQYSTEYRAEQARWNKVTLVETGDWQAEWISTGHGLFSKAPEANTWWNFRKTFALETLPTQAKARIAADTHYWLWVNGKLVVREGGLKRGPNVYGTYYDTVDIAPYLVSGENTIAIQVWYLGKDSFSHHNSGEMGLIFDLQTPDWTLVSDSSWKMKQDEAYYDTLDPNPNFRLAESNVGYDARQATPGWQAVDFDDHDWAAAGKAGKPPAAPWYNLVARPIPLWKDSDLQDYVSVKTEETENHTQLVRARLPSNTQVLPYLQVKAREGLTIDIRTDAYQNGGANSVRAEYVTANGEQEFECPGWMNGDEVEYNLPADVELIAVKYRQTQYNSQKVGGFNSDNSFLNQLYEKSYWTMRVNMRDTFMDNPNRDRAQWWGDEMVELQGAGYALDANGQLLTRKGILELAGWQKADGSLFSPIPAGNWDQEVPIQSLQAVYGIYRYYMLTGDQDTVRSAYPAMKRYLELWQIGSDGLVIHRQEGWERYDSGDQIDAPVLENGWYVLALQSQYQLAAAAGQTEDQPVIQKKLEGVTAAFRSHFRTADGFRSPEYTGGFDDRAQAVAVVSGLAESSDYPAILKVFHGEGKASPLMENFVIQALYLMNEPEYAHERLHQRYAAQVESDRSTLGEDWDLDSTVSTYNDGGASGALYLLPAYTGGIQPLQPGYRSVLIAPRLGNLNRVITRVPSPYGMIEENIQRSNQGMKLQVTVPLKTSGWMALDKTYFTDFTHVRILWQNKLAAITATREDDHFYYYPLVAGLWEFNLEQ